MHDTNVGKNCEKWKKKVKINIFISANIYTCFGLLWAHQEEIQLCLYDTLYLLFCVDDRLICRVGTLHTRQSSTQSDKYQVSHRYSCCVWWWAHSCPKHVEKRNKHTKKNCAPSWLYLQDYKEMQGQQNKKFCVLNSEKLFWMLGKRAH